MKKNNALHHCVTIVPTWTRESKKQLIKSLKSMGVEAACILYTPFDEENSKFFLKNTLHIFYYGKLRSSDALQIFPQDDLDGTNKTLFKILQRQFLNCGIKKGMHPVSWIGKSIYCTLESEKSSTDGRNCPHCNKRLRLIYFSGQYHPLDPDISFVGDLRKQTREIYCTIAGEIKSRTVGWEYCFSESIWHKIKRIIKNTFNGLKSKSVWHLITLPFKLFY